MYVSANEVIKKSGVHIVIAGGLRKFLKTGYYIISLTISKRATRAFWAA